MSCIILVGGGIGCGKSTLIDFLLKHKAILFSSDKEISKTVDFLDENKDAEVNNISLNFRLIQFDALCSIQEQEKLMKTLRGLRNFRCDLLMAAERFIGQTCRTEDTLSGPLTNRSENLLQKLNLLNKFDDDCPSNTFFFVEDNFYYRSMRYDWFQIARRANVGFATVFLNCPVSIAVQRNAQRGYQIPENQIKKMCSFLEFPDPSKFKWEKYSTLFDSSVELTNSALKDVINVIKEASRNPAELVISEEKIAAQKICSKNAVHQADKILRRIVSKNISTLKSACDDEDFLKIVISNLVCVRQKLLCDIKQGIVNLPEDLIEKIQNLGIESVLEAYEESLNIIFSLMLEEKKLLN